LLLVVLTCVETGCDCGSVACSLISVLLFVSENVAAVYPPHGGSLSECQSSAPALSRAALGEEDFKLGYIQSELTPEADQIWLDAWNEIQAGG